MKRILFPLLLLYPLAIHAQDLWHISWLNEEPVTIDSKALKTGDDFDSEQSIVWKDENQVMKAMDVQTKRCLVLSARGLPGKTGGLLKDYVAVSKKLSTRSAATYEASMQGSYHYLRYLTDDSYETLRLVPGIMLWDLPDKIELCYYDAVNDTLRTEAEDFRSVQDDLIITTALVLRLIDTGVFTEEEFLSLLYQFADDATRKTSLTFEEIKTIITIKY